jgi:hypothetical protein
VHVAPAALQGLSSRSPLEPLILIRSSIAAHHAHGVGEVTPQQKPLLHRHAGTVRARAKQRRASKSRSDKVFFNVAFPLFGVVPISS